MAGIEDYFIRETRADPHMSVHPFKGILEEHLAGEKTGAESRTAMETYIEAELNEQAVTDIGSIITYITAGADYPEKRERLSRIYNVLILAESGIWYETREKLRTRLLGEMA